MAQRSPDGEPPAPTEQQVQEDLIRLDAYRSQLNGLVQQHQILVASRQDHLRARESLEGIDRATSSDEILLPLGGEAYVRGRVHRESPVLVGIGSGIATEMNRAQAAEVIAQRITRIEQAVQDIESQMGAVDERIQLLSRRLDAASRSARAPSDVGRD
ncbi:MAG TPA: prefoldin subunit alpha [Thermoplasmata archaeon]|nr:prefoldin subunit alpha [Thermoplasmata archaeon]